MSQWDRASKDECSGGRIPSVIAAALFSSLIVWLYFSGAAAQTSSIIGMADPLEGDAIEIGGQHIRLSGVDAPESGRRCGEVDVYERSRVALRELIGRQTVSCSVSGRDRDGRLIGRCAAGGDDLAEAMVIEGWVRDWPYYSGGEYADEEAGARSGREGIWGLQCPADLWGDRDYSLADESVETFAPASAPADVEVAYVTATALNVRAGSGANHPVTGLLPHRESVEVLERRGEWARIRAQWAHTGGWVASRYLSADQPESPRAVFARHDPQQRLPNTTIRRIGTVRVRNSVYAIYYLDFANPVTLHGQQRIAIIKNGHAFMGSYQCTLGRGPDDGRVVIGSDRLTVRLNVLSFVIRFNERGPTRNRHFCGEGSGWEDGI